MGGGDFCIIFRNGGIYFEEDCCVFLARWEPFARNFLYFILQTVQFTHKISVYQNQNQNLYSLRSCNKALGKDKENTHTYIHIHTDTDGGSIISQIRRSHYRFRGLVQRQGFFCSLISFFVAFYANMAWNPAKKTYLFLWILADCISPTP